MRYFSIFLHLHFYPTNITHTVNDMIEHPFETKSDSFYFVDDRLIMHNKASYKVSESLAIVIAIVIVIEVMHQRYGERIGSERRGERK